MSPIGLSTRSPSRAICSRRAGRTRNVTSAPASASRPPKCPPMPPAPRTRIFTLISLPLGGGSGRGSLESVRQIVRRRIPLTERCEGEAAFDEFQDRRRIVLRVIDEALLRVRRHDDRGNARARAPAIAARRRHVVPSPAVLVVRD